MNTARHFLRDQIQSQYTKILLEKKNYIRMSACKVGAEKADDICACDPQCPRYGPTAVPHSPMPISYRKFWRRSWPV